MGHGARTQLERDPPVSCPTLLWRASCLGAAALAPTALVAALLGGCGDDGANASSDASLWFDGGVLGPEMVSVAAGDFQMGCDPAVTTTCHVSQMPIHAVTLSAYEIDRTEVTQAAYEACVADGMCGLPMGDYDPAERGAHPVRYITWDGAVTYCQWVGKRLPTEAEWEKAARGDDRRLYPWGNDAPDCAHASFSGCPGNDTHEVATHHDGVSPYGAEDMAGNVFEFVSDWYQVDYYQVSPAIDPTGPATGTIKVVRGGAYGSLGDRLRASNRATAGTAGPGGVGIRCARN